MTLPAKDWQLAGIALKCGRKSFDLRYCQQSRQLWKAAHEALLQKMKETEKKHNA